MKKALSSVFLFIFLFNVCGFYLVFDIRQAENRFEMQSQLNTANPSTLLEIKVPEQLIKKANSVFVQTGEDEIMYCGQMYDVASSKINADSSVSFFCINDAREEILNTELAQQVQDNNDNLIAASHHTSQKQTLKNQIRDYLPEYPLSISVSFFRIEY
ncbi:MAG TPA: hypothetical protein VGO45_04105, partial [Bacteroidia bacterium]|nr:hypothetical protein [Bacteroidia bacterium]